MAVAPPPDPARGAYWFPEDSAVDVLQALRGFRAADTRMRRRLAADMELNSTDLEALRHVIAAERRGESVTPRGLAETLQITTASVTKLLDRLVDAGHLRRVPHAHDRRSRVVTATDHAHQETREHLGAMHDRMLAAARAVPEESRAAVISFLTDMAEAVGGDAAAPAGTTADTAADGEMPEEP